MIYKYDNKLDGKYYSDKVKQKLHIVLNQVKSTTDKKTKFE